jgi:Golgi phosphoprotein 3
MGHKMLTIYEELQLLSIHEDKGIFIRSAADALVPGMSGAILSDLALAGKICTSDNHRLKLEESDPTNDSVLDDTIKVLKKSQKERKFGYWISKINPKPEKLRRQVTKSLISKGILTQEDDRLLWVIPSPLQPDGKGSSKYWLIEHLRGIILAQEDYQPHDVALLGLLNACGLLGLVFLRDERKLAIQAINERLVYQAMQDPNLETIQEIDAAIASVVEED